MSDVIYIGCNLDSHTFQDEFGNPIRQVDVKRLWDAGKLDATMMVQRLITKHDWDFDALKQFYDENE